MTEKKPTTTTKLKRLPTLEDAVARAISEARRLPRESQPRPLPNLLAKSR